MLAWLAVHLALNVLQILEQFRTAFTSSPADGLPRRRRTVDGGAIPARGAKALHRRAQHPADELVPETVPVLGHEADYLGQGRSSSFPKNTLEASRISFALRSSVFFLRSRLISAAASQRGPDDQKLSRAARSVQP